MSAAGSTFAPVVAAIKALLDSPESKRYDYGSFGPILVRLAWHASGTYCAKTQTGGSNFATIRFAPECKWGANAGLEVARQVLEPIKARFPAVSYADLYTLAGAVAIEHLGGPAIPWAAGRTDASDGSGSVEDGRLPDAAQGAAHIRDVFYRMGFNDQEIVALIGAHALGGAHTANSGFEGPWTLAPTRFSNLFYKELLNRTWVQRQWSGPKQFQPAQGPTVKTAAGVSQQLMMLPADLAFKEDAAFRKHVEHYAADNQAFRKDFAAAFGKLLALGVPKAQAKL